MSDKQIIDKLLERVARLEALVERQGNQIQNAFNIMEIKK